MDELKKFIEYYLFHLKICISQVPEEIRRLFPTYFTEPYIVEIKQCLNGIAFYFRRRAEKMSFHTHKVDVPTEEAFLPYLPPPQYYAVFKFGNGTRIKLQRIEVFNFDFSKNPKRGKMYQKLGENFDRRSVMHLEGSNEIQMIDCTVKGVTNRGKLNRHIDFLWMFTDEYKLDQEEAIKIAGEDFIIHLNNILFIYDKWYTINPATKKALIMMLNDIRRKYLELTSLTEGNEQKFQDFLELYTMIIDPKADIIYNQISLSEQNRVDFILLYNNSIRIVEIKKPYDNIFNKNKEFSEITHEALEELHRYRKWIEYNNKEVELRFNKTELEKGWAIIGKKSDLTREEKEILKKWNDSNEETKIIGYDELLEHINNRIDALSEV